MLGTLSLGVLLDEQLADQFKRAHAAARWPSRSTTQVRAATLPRIDAGRRCRSLADQSAAASIRVGDAEYVGLALPLRRRREPGTPAAGGPVAATLVLQSRTERLRFLRTVDTALVVAALAAVLLATVLSYAVARTVTRPLGAITDTMREVAATGDLTRKITLRGPAVWQDEDARLLADDVQHADRLDRALPARGRAEGAAALARPAVDGDRARSAQPADDHQGGAAHACGPRRPPPRSARRSRDIDEEVDRLNRIVNDVLDFARPPVFSLEPADLVRALSATPPMPRRPAATAPPSVRRCRPTPLLVVDRRGAPADGAGQHARERAAGGAGARDRASRAARPRRHRRDVRAAARAERVRRRPACRSRDRGTGIRPEDLSQIFEPYFTTRRTGTGLGLPIARNIVEGLGGTMAIATRRGRHDDRYRAARTPARSRRHMTATGSILLVDDEEKILKTLGRALRDRGPPGRRARRTRARPGGCIADEAFDVLIVDNLMPGMTGLELIRDVVASVPERERPQIVMMTAHATVADAIEAMKLGALDFLQKPFEVDHLLVTVSRAIEHQRLRTAAPLPAQRARRGVQPLRHRRPQPDDAGGDPPRRARGRDARAPCSSRARRAPARSWWRGRFTIAARSGTCRSSR